MTEYEQSEREFFDNLLNVIRVVTMILVAMWFLGLMPTEVSEEQETVYEPEFSFEPESYWRARGYVLLCVPRFSSLLYERVKWMEHEHAVSSSYGFCYLFPPIVADVASELEEVWESRMVPVQIVAKERIIGDSSIVDVVGYPMADGDGIRDYVSLISGNIGTLPDGRYYIEKGSVLRMEIPEKVIPMVGDEFEVTRVRLGNGGNMGAGNV